MRPRMRRPNAGSAGKRERRNREGAHARTHHRGDGGCATQHDSLHRLLLAERPGWSGSSIARGLLVLDLRVETQQLLLY